MKAIVTGGAGFIGSNTARYLLNKDYEVIVIDNLETGNIDNIPDNVKFYETDISNSNVIDILQNEKADYIFHFAAQIDVRKSLENPIFDLNTNIIGTINILDGIKRAGKGKIIFASSGGVMYGECETPKDENERENPLSPYGISKLAAEKYIRCYSQCHNVPYVILRFANVYGPFQSNKGEAGVIAIFIEQIKHNEKSQIFGYGKMTRDYIYVKDVAKVAYITALEVNKEIINVGTMRGTDNITIYKKIADIMQKEYDYELKEARNSELISSIVNNQKLGKYLSLSELINIDSGLKGTVDWYLSHD